MKSLQPESCWYRKKQNKKLPQIDTQCRYSKFALSTQNRRYRSRLYRLYKDVHKTLAVGGTFRNAATLLDTAPTVFMICHLEEYTVF